MKKIPTLLLCLAVATAALTGCASSSSPAPSNSGTPSAGSSSSTASQEPVTLSITWWGSQTRHDYTQQLLDSYTEKNPHVTFQSTPSGWDGYFDKLSAQAAGGKLPDIIQMDYLYISTFSENDSLADLSTFVADGVLDLTNVDENLFSAGIIGGKTTGVPLSSSILSFPYNPAVLAEAGLEAPAANWTWPEFMEMCKTIHEKTGKIGFSANVIDTNILNYWVRQSGQPLFSADNKTLGYDDDQIFASFAQMQKDLVEAGAMPNPDEWIQISSLGKEAGPVITGDAGFTIEWSNYGVVAAPTNPDIKLLTPPYADNGTKALWIKPGMFFSVAKSSSAQEDAAKFINWFINDTAANDVIMAERGIPVSSAIRDHLAPKLSEKQQEMFDYMNLALEHAAPIAPPEPQGISEINRLLIDTLDQVLYNRLTPEQAAKSFREEANNILTRNNSKV